MDKYQNSMCDGQAGLLHDYRKKYEATEGIVEQCQHCGVCQFFPWEVKNETYLSYHIKSALQPYDELFRINYPNFQHI